MRWDVFISHAFEDKEAFARPLACALESRGLKVWFDEFTLVIGDSLRRSIDHGLGNSRFGITILSPRFFEKDWPQKELDGLVAREINGIKVILPVWHDVNRAEVLKYSPILADRLAVSTGDGMEKVVSELLRAIRRDGASVEPAPVAAKNVTNIPNPDISLASPKKGENEAKTETPISDFNSTASSNTIADKAKAAAPEFIRLVLSGEKLMFERRWREKGDWKGANIKTLYDAVASSCNVLVEQHIVKCDAINLKLRRTIPSDLTIENFRKKSETLDPKVSTGAFIIFSNAVKVLGQLQNKIFDSDVIYADEEIRRALESVKSVDILTPAVSHGQTIEKENSTYPSHWREQPKQEIMRDMRKQISEDVTLRFLKSAFSQDSGQFQTIEFKIAKSRVRQHVVVNPYACYWSGEIDYDEVVYDHFFRWHLKLATLPDLFGVSRVSTFSLESLDPKIDFEI